MSGSERINEQPEVGPKGAAPKGRRKSKYFLNGAILGMRKAEPSRWAAAS
jgi:hypothetical protein